MGSGKASGTGWRWKEKALKQERNGRAGREMPEHEMWISGSVERRRAGLIGHITWSEGRVRGLGFVLSAWEAIEGHSDF